MGIDLLLEPPLRGRTSLERNCSFFSFSMLPSFFSPGGCKVVELVVEMICKKYLILTIM